MAELDPSARKLGNAALAASIFGGSAISAKLAFVNYFTLSGGDNSVRANPRSWGKLRLFVRALWQTGTPTA